MQRQTAMAERFFGGNGHLHTICGYTNNSKVSEGILEIMYWKPL